MKRKLSICFLIIVTCFTLTSCGQKKLTLEEELNSVNNKISSYFESFGADYDNLSSHYVDTINKVVIVELAVNTKAEQDRFKSMVVSSDLIKFIQGGPYETFE